MNLKVGDLVQVTQCGDSRLHGTHGVVTEIVKPHQFYHTSTRVPCARVMMDIPTRGGIKFVLFSRAHLEIVNESR